MEYDHGVRVTPLAHEMTALEAGILEYQRQVEQYHQDKAKACATDEERFANDEKLAQRREFLDSRRRDLLTQAQVQEGLHKYREGARLEDNEWIYDEEHHPTGQLVQFMESEGDVKPADNCQAHHIIPGKGWRSMQQIAARLKLHDCNVGINDPANGVWLPAEIQHVPHFIRSLRRALPHGPLHTKKYEMWANNSVRAAHNESTARMALNRMRTRLLNGLDDLDLIGTLTQKSRKRLGL
ncbi:AHH domain-containing protein [Microbulbifer hainanensis]|uniref:AHH domain-containing protein n=1 Tax=Microbulbifer hainanensis TaxID=2735675 RepID=UPI0018668871|nr:AHH domain-containing protein [Microbulbifer hainanensis]